MTHLLGRIRYTSQASEPRLGPDGLTMDVHLTVAGAPDTVEQWTASGPVTLVPGPVVQYAHDGKTALFAARIPWLPRYAASVEDLYTEIFSLTAAAGYPHIFRVWQYIEGINQPNADGLETYRDYCIGRAAAFARRGGNAYMPAATGVGARSGGISIHLLSGRTPVVQIENPRQLPAYRYPKQHGPKPPSFARATWRDNELYIAGTASIIGHRTMFPSDIVAQCKTTLSNIEALLHGGNLARHGIDATLSLTNLNEIKVYVRREEDVPPVKRLCGSAIAEHARISFIITGLCRADLLVEIEGVARTGQSKGSMRCSS